VTFSMATGLLNKHLSVQKSGAIHDRRKVRHFIIHRHMSISGRGYIANQPVSIGGGGIESGGHGAAWPRFQA